MNLVREMRRKVRARTNDDDDDDDDNNDDVIRRNWQTRDDAYAENENEQICVKQNERER